MFKSKGTCPVHWTFPECTSGHLLVSHRWPKIIMYIPQYYWWMWGVCSWSTITLHNYGKSEYSSHTVFWLGFYTMHGSCCLTTRTRALCLCDICISTYHHLPTTMYIHNMYCYLNYMSFMSYMSFCCNDSAAWGRIALVYVCTWCTLIIIIYNNICISSLLCNEFQLLFSRHQRRVGDSPYSCVSDYSAMVGLG